MFKSPKSCVLLEEEETILPIREHKFYHWYRQSVIQVIVKAIIMTPIVVWWFLWISELMDVVDAHWDDVLLTGSVFSYTWLSLSAYFNWQLSLDMWSIFNIFWTVPMFLAALDLIYVSEYLFGIIIMILSLMSMIDGFLSTSFQLPHFLRYTQEDLEERRKEKMETVVVKPSKPVGIPFMIIPLDGGKNIPLAEFPSMSTPSTSRQAYSSEKN